MSIRIKCKGCDNTFRVSVAETWADPKVTRTVLVTDKDNPTGPKISKTEIVNPGRHNPKYDLCRRCYKAKQNKQRPNTNKRQPRIRVPKAPKPVALPTNKGKKGKAA